MVTDESSSRQADRDRASRSTPPYFRRLSEHVVERLNEFTTALEHTTALSIERFEITAETAVTTAISRLSLAASQLELERQGRVSLGSRSSSGVSSASPSKLVDQRPAAGDQERLDELEWEHQKKGEEMWQARRLIKDLRSQVKKSADKAAAVTARAAAEARSLVFFNKKLFFKLSF